MTGDNFKTYDFLINEEDEVMLLLYAREGEPQNAIFEFNAEEKNGILYRNEQDNVSLSGIPDDVLDSLEEADTLLVCELSTVDDDKDAEIVYAYEAEINV